MRPQMQLRPAERATAGRFALAQHGGDLGKLVLEDLAQQEDRALERLELLQQHQERQRDRLLQLDALLRVARLAARSSAVRIGSGSQGPTYSFALAARQLELIHA